MKQLIIHFQHALAALREINLMLSAAQFRIKYPSFTPSPDRSKPQKKYETKINTQQKQQHQQAA
ncbi:CLUMA_CG003175, isoform A [Clunio marinus]|uniref:CLUMA_CG003175, isoform A n=1 Tax=Clunio marinus TaxID=568069 RepID=A0A1J1HPG8_9DIPT|nr:CLUMA_CG003175, isoform A [Clunio marinus]